MNENYEGWVKAVGGDERRLAQTLLIWEQDGQYGQQEALMVAIVAVLGEEAAERIDDLYANWPRHQRTNI